MTNQCDAGQEGRLALRQDLRRLGLKGLQTLILNSVWWTSGLADCEWVTSMFLENRVRY